jgi:TIR domain/AAA ATPase domain
MTVPTSPHSPAPIDVFISYSHEDDYWRKELEKHLSNLKRQREIADWSDRKIEAGSEWEAQLKDKLESSPIILLLISADFLNSDYCYDIEMRRAIERHDAGTAKVIPIILRPCDWQHSKFSKLQVLPQDGEAVTLWKNQDSAFLDVVQGIRRSVDSLTKKVITPEPDNTDQDSNNLALQPPLPPWERAGVRVPGSPSTSPFITGTPIEHPKNFFGREKELKRLFNLLKTRPLQNAAIIGKRRSGKTSLLNYLRRITTTPVEQLRPGQRCDWLPNPQAYRWIFVDFQDVRMAQRERLLRFLLESMELPVPVPCDLESFMDQVSGNVQQPTVILMDEIGVGLRRCPELDDEFWECLRALATNQTDGNLAFVLAIPESPIELAHNTGHSSPFFNIFGYTTILGALTESEVRELVNSSPLPFAAKDIDWILNHNDCWPHLLQILCHERLLYLQEEDLSDEWQQKELR